MSGFIDWLEGLGVNDTRVRAILCRSLAFNPGAYVPAYPYVEPFIKEGHSSWRREMHYLVAGLWAMHWRDGRMEKPMTIGEACSIFDGEKRKNMSQDDRRKLSSTERRFITLLDSDSEQLPHRLRQMIALLKEQNIDFEGLLKGLLYWDDDKKRTQNAWARDFYRSMDYEAKSESSTQKEDDI